MADDRRSAVHTSSLLCLSSVLFCQCSGLSQATDAHSEHNMRRTLIVAPFVFSFPLAILVSIRTSTEVSQTNIATPKNVSGFRLRATLSGPSVRLGYGWSAPMAFSSGGDSLAVGSHGGSISLWDVRTGVPKAVRHRPHRPTLTYSPLPDVPL